MLVPWRKWQDPHNCSYKFHLLEAREEIGTQLGKPPPLHSGVFEQSMSTICSGSCSTAVTPDSSWHLKNFSGKKERGSCLSSCLTKNHSKHLLVWNWSKEISPTIQPLLCCFIYGENSPSELEVIPQPILPTFLLFALTEIPSFEGETFIDYIFHNMFVLISYLWYHFQT